MSQSKRHMLGKWFAVSCDGHMTPAEMLKELQRDKICPIMCYNEERNGKTVTIIPLFISSQLAEQFAKRNTPRIYTIGTMEACNKNLERLEESGYVVEELRWSKKRNCTIVPLDMSDQEVQTHNCGYRTSKNQ